MACDVRLVVSCLFLKANDMQAYRETNKDIHNGHQRFGNQATQRKQGESVNWITIRCQSDQEAGPSHPTNIDNA